MVPIVLFTTILFAGLGSERRGHKLLAGRTSSSSSRTILATATSARLARRTIARRGSTRWRPKDRSGQVSMSNRCVHRVARRSLPAGCRSATGCSALQVEWRPRCSVTMQRRGCHSRKSPLRAPEISRLPTGMVGKWHLGQQPQFLPMRQGFDSWYGLPYRTTCG